MNRKIAALALGFGAMLVGACASKSENATTETTVAADEAPAPSEPPADLELIDVPVSKPAPGTKVDPATLPAEVSNFVDVPGLSPDQQSCVNGAIKQAVDADASLAKTPGKVMSLGGKAVTICDGGAVFTEPLLDGLGGGESSVQITPAQKECFKQAFATDKDNTAKVISGSMSMNLKTIKEALVPFETKCGVKISGAFES